MRINQCDQLQLHCVHQRKGLKAERGEQLEDKMILALNMIIQQTVWICVCCLLVLRIIWSIVLVKLLCSPQIPTRSGFSLFFFSSFFCIKSCLTSTLTVIMKALVGVCNMIRFWFRTFQLPVPSSGLKLGLESICADFLPQPKDRQCRYEFQYLVICLTVMDGDLHYPGSTFPLSSDTRISSTPWLFLNPEHHKRV